MNKMLQNYALNESIVKLGTNSLCAIVILY